MARGFHIIAGASKLCRCQGGYRVAAASCLVPASSCIFNLRLRLQSLRHTAWCRYHFAFLYLLYRLSCALRHEIDFSTRRLRSNHIAVTQPRRLHHTLSTSTHAHAIATIDRLFFSPFFNCLEHLHSIARLATITFRCTYPAAATLLHRAVNTASSEVCKQNLRRPSDRFCVGVHTATFNHNGQ